MKAVLFKYGADPKSPNLYDSKSDHCDLTDPDFVTNGQPVWSICGPYVRKNLEQGDVLFFLPQKSRLLKAGRAPDYICTGVLVVQDIIREGGRDLKDSRLSEKYRRQYVHSYNLHIKGSKGERGDQKRAPRTAMIRSHNIILGDPRRSRWLEEPWPKVRPIYRSLGFPGKNLGFQRIPFVKEESKVRKLYRKVTGHDLS